MPLAGHWRQQHDVQRRRHDCPPAAFRRSRHAHRISQLAASQRNSIWRCFIPRLPRRGGPGEDAVGRRGVYRAESDVCRYLRARAGFRQYRDVESLPHARYSAGARQAVQRRRRPAWRSGHRHVELRPLAAAVRGRPLRGWPVDHRQRRAHNGYRRDAADIRLSAIVGRLDSPDADRAHLAARPGAVFFRLPALRRARQSIMRARISSRSARSSRKLSRKIRDGRSPCGIWATNSSRTTPALWSSS
jgi:hypothetical protein